MLLLTLGLTIASFGQTQDINCNCPKNEFAGTKAQTTFSLSNGVRFALCGYVEGSGSERLFSEFVLAVCGQDKIIDFWDALTICRISTQQDTLRIEELKSLPIGENFKVVSAVWRIEKIYFKSGQLQRVGVLNREFRKYSAREIDSVLAEFAHLNRKVSYNDMDLVNKLFVAAISGSRTARKYLADKTKFETLDGAFKEEYEELQAMLNSWG